MPRFTERSADKNRPTATNPYIFAGGIVGPIALWFTSSPARVASGISGYDRPERSIYRCVSGQSAPLGCQSAYVTSHRSRHLGNTLRCLLEETKSIGIYNLVSILGGIDCTLEKPSCT